MRDGRRRNSVSGPTWSAAETGRGGLRRVIAWPSRGWPDKTHGADGRLHLSHGPIDLIFDLGGAPEEVAAAEAAAGRAFDGLLEALVAELPLLRSPVGARSPDPEGAVARRMMRAVRPFADRFVTPMAAVAGAVADHMLDAIRAEAGVSRAVINNGGDIAIHLIGAQRYRIGIHDYRQFGRYAGIVEVGASDGIGGVATSGWRGRSHSLGIADAVTVLAATAAGADAAATLIANAVDLPGSPRVTRRPARDLSPDSDLGDRLVTVDVAELSPGEIAVALGAGVVRAQDFVARGLIRAAFLSLQGQARGVGAGFAAAMRIEDDGSKSGGGEDR
ncbi:MAG: hypothetical protein B7Z02_01885 [Rhodobacterales bacterium 32-67-9]|nr:MAG: hypothetical protein B7Z02_01885 [Rhodobacterales bacterium 32-67-9]